MALSITETRQIKAGVVSFATNFDRLATTHTGRSGNDLLTSLGTAQGRRQYELLIGAMVKAETPAAVAAPRTPSPLMTVAAPGGGATFKAHAFKAAAKAKTKAKAPGKASAAKAKPAETEAGLGRKMLNAFHNRICGSAETSQAVKDAIKKAEDEGHKLADPTVNGISVGAASIVAVAIGSLFAAPVAAVAAPVIGGVALLLMQVGVEGFCDWSKDKPASKPKPTPKPKPKPDAKKKKRL
jgi:hypothetical protein